MPQKRRHTTRKSSSPQRKLQRSWRRWRGRLIVWGALLFVVLFVLDKSLGPQMCNGTGTHALSQGYDGIDVSKFQGRIDWQTVAAQSDVRFVYIKATEGSTVSDSRYARNLKGAREAGLPVGSYHYFIGRRSARDQFDNFCRTVPRDEQDLLPMVDVEEAGNRLVAPERLRENLREFMELIHEEYGVYPILYSQYGFYNARLAGHFDDCLIFMARYSKQEPRLKGKAAYAIWQYSERGHIPGIKGTVDLDRFSPRTTLSDLRLHRGLFR